MGVFDRTLKSVVTVTHVAESLGCSPEAARTRLRELEDVGRLESFDTPAGTAWIRTESEDDPEDLPPEEEPGHESLSESTLCGIYEAMLQ